MEFAEVVYKRRLVRNFSGGAVSSDAVEHLLDYAQRGPSAGFTQGQDKRSLSLKRGRRSREKMIYWERWGIKERQLGG